MTDDSLRNNFVMTELNARFYISFVKPLLDWMLALIAAIVLLPLFVIVAVAIKVDTIGPAFFLQERLGRHGKVFKIIKFRSMVVDNKSSSGA